MIGSTFSSSDLSSLVLQPEQRMNHLSRLFVFKQCWDEGAWAHFPGVDLDLKVEDPAPLNGRVSRLARTRVHEDGIRVILVPGRLTLQKIREILRSRHIVFEIMVSPEVEAEIKETEKPEIYVVKMDAQDKAVEEDNFNLLTLVTLVATSYQTVKGKTVPFQGRKMLCKEQNGKNYAVLVTERALLIAPCDPAEPHLVSGTMVKAT